MIFPKAYGTLTFLGSPGTYFSACEIRTSKRQGEIRTGEIRTSKRQGVLALEQSRHEGREAEIKKRATWWG